MSDGEGLRDAEDLNHMASMQPHVPISRTQAGVPAQLTPPGSPRPSAAGGAAPGPWQSENICFQSCFAFFLIGTADD